MKKVPFVFQGAVRKVYFSVLDQFIKDVGFILDLENYENDVILAERSFRSPEIVAIIESHSAWGEPNDLTNELTPMGYNARKYDGLKIIVRSDKYLSKIEKLADVLKKNLEEEVIIVT